MAEIVIGDIVSRLRLDATAFTQGMQQALQALQAFQTQMQSQGGQAVQQAMQQATQGTQQFAQQLQLLNQQTITQTGFLGQMAAGLDQVRAALERVGTQAAQTRQPAQQATSSLQAIFQIAAGIGLATTIQGIVRALEAFATESVRVAASMQDLHRSFLALEGSGTAANRTLNFLFETAQKTGTNFQELAEAYRRLEAGAKGTVLSGEDLRRALEGIAAGARVMGLSAQQSQSALIAWEQILTKGRLSSEELVRQLGNAVPGGLERVARALNVTTQELRAMAEAGLVPGTVAFVAFSEEMRKVGESGGSLEGLTKTFADFTNEITAWKTAIGDLIGTAIQPWIEKITELSKALRDLMGIRPPGQTAPGAGPATPAGPYTSATQFPLAPSPYTALIQQEARRSAIDPGLLSQLVRAESGFNPTSVSPAGAIGLGQLMLPTAQGLETGVTREALMEPERNLRLAAKYLADQLEQFRQFDDQVKLALAAYNAGPGTVQNLLNAARAAGRPRTFAEIAPQLPQETQTYVGRVLDFPAMQAAAAPAQAAQAATSEQNKVEVLRKQVQDLLDMLPRLQKQVTDIQSSTGNVGQILDKDVSAAITRIVQRFADMQQTFATLPRLAEQLPSSLRASFDEATKQVAIWQQLTLSDAQRRDLLKQQVEAMEQLTLRQQAQLLQQRQGQEAAERFTRERTQALQEERLADRPRLAGLTLPQQIADYTARLQRLQAQADQLGTQIETQRAEVLRPQLEAQLAQIETFLGRAGASLADQAANAIRQRQPEIERTLAEMLRTIGQHPALTDMAHRISSALADLPAATEEQAQRAFDRIQARQREQVQGLGASLIQISERMSATGTTPLDAALAQIDRSFVEMGAHLERFQEQLTELGTTGTPAVQAQVAYWQQWTKALQDGLPAAQALAEGLARLHAQIEASAQATQNSARQFEFLRDTQLQLEEMRQPADTGQEAFFGLESQARRRIRLQAERTPLTEEGRAQLNQTLAQMQAQERLNYAAQLFEQFGTSVAQAWTSALTGIADGTRTVSEAFREMARSILQSLAQIAAQEGFKALVGLGVRLIAGAATSGLGAGPNAVPFGPEASASSIAYAVPRFASGGVVNQPTFAMIGERQQEAVVNRDQMATILDFARRSAPSAGGQALGGEQGITIINVSTAQQAEQERARQEALGQRVVVNHVLSDLAAGEGSRINRTIRALQR